MEGKNLTITVSQDIIDAAKRGHSRKCMVAEAIREQVPGCSGIDVSADSIHFNLPDKKSGQTIKHVYPTPGATSKNIQEFDTKGGDGIKPFKIKLRADQCATRIVKPKPRKGKIKILNSKRCSRRSKALCRRAVVRRRHGYKELITT